MAIHKDFTNLIDQIIKYQNDDYYQYVFDKPMSLYEERVDMIGFKGLDNILDAGCGYGQWSVVLSKYNKNVVSIDHSENMLKSTEVLKEYYKRDNIDIQQAKLPKLDFEDNSFDAIWCWSVFMFIDRDELLKEFHRVLKPGGKILIGGYNARGRWLFKMIKAIKDKNKKRFLKAMEVFLKGNDIKYRPNFTNLSNIEKVYEPYGFNVIAKDFDGHIDISGKNRIKEITKPRYYRMENNIEFILEKEKNEIIYKK